MYVSIRLLLVDWMIALHASFFAIDRISLKLDGPDTVCCNCSKIKNICKHFHGPP